MIICLINPNTTKIMTKTVETAAKQIASVSTEIVATNPDDGPESIEGYYDEVFCVPGIIKEVRAHKNADAFIIACFDDTGLDAVRTITDKPVIGIGNSAFQIASCLACSFSVITTLDVSVPILQTNISKYGFERKCVNVSSVQIPVLELENASGECLLILENEVERTLTEDKAEAIVLGCAGMADFAKKLEEKFKVPIIEGVSAAVVIAEGLIKMKKNTSKIGGYSYPREKLYSGTYKSFQFNKIS